MVYSSKFVMAVLVNGVPQKELANGVIPIPFEAEYSLRFRNKNNRRAVVKFFIDGENVSGSGYIINANSFIDIKRHYEIDRTFKFVSLESAEAVDFGKNGDNSDKVKGVIEARFFLEKEVQKPVQVHNHYHTYSPFRYPPRCRGLNLNDHNDQIYKGIDNNLESLLDLNLDREREMETSSDVLGFSSCDSHNSQNRSLKAQNKSLQDGCTVEGNVSGQNFYKAHIEYETEYVALKVFLQGFVQTPDSNLISQPLSKAVVPNKDNGLISELEKKNEELRRKIAELEHEKLTLKLAELQS